MNEFMKWFTIATITAQIIQNFLNAGGPAPNPAIVQQEVSKELVRKAAAGMIPDDFLEDHEEVIQAAIEAHPGIPLPKTA